MTERNTLQNYIELGDNFMDEEYNEWLDQQYFYEMAGSFESVDINNNEE